MIIPGGEVGGPLRSAGSALPAGPEGAKPVGAGGAPAASGGPAADGVVVSTGAQQVAGWLTALHALPDVRDAAVAEVRARMQGGSQPGAADVAASILRQSAPPGGR